MAYSTYQKLQQQALGYKKPTYDGPSADVDAYNKTLIANKIKQVNRTPGYDGPSDGDLANYYSKNMQELYNDPSLNPIPSGTKTQPTTSQQPVVPTVAPAPTVTPTNSYVQQLQDFKLPDAPTAPEYSQAPDYATVLQRAKDQYQNMYNPLKSQAIDNINERANQMGLLQRGTTQPLFAQYKAINDLNNEQVAKAMDLANQILQQERDNTFRDNQFKYQQYSDTDARNFRNAQFDYGKLQDLLGQQNADRQFDYTKGIDQRNYDYQVGQDALQQNNWQKQYDRGVLENDRNYNYQQGRDKVTDNQWNTQFNYNKGVDTRNYNYQTGRDKVADSHWNKEYSLSAKRASSSGRRSGGSGGSSKGSSGKGYDQQELGSAYLNIVIGSRNNKSNAQAQFERDQGNLRKLGMSEKEISYIQKQIDSKNDDWVGPSYGKVKNPLSGFWGSFDKNYKYVK